MPTSVKLPTTPPRFFLNLANLSPECARMLSETLLEAIGLHSVPACNSVC
jgi:hypothetical protein